jgi:twinkle protein
MPSGASNLTWIENDFHALQNFEKIYILTDQDEAGENCALEIAKRLGRARCCRVPLPGKWKDANEALMKGEPDELEIHEWISRAVTFDPPTLQAAGDFRQKAHTALMKTKSEGEERTFLFPELPFQYRDGETTVITGSPGHGKSDLLYQTHIHEMTAGKRVCIASFEIPPGEMLVIIAWQMKGKEPTPAELDEALDWMDGKLWFFAPAEEDIKWSSVIEDFRYCAQRFGINRFVVDSLHFLCDKDDYEDQDKFVKAICRFGTLQNVHVALVAHANLRKDDWIPGLQDVEGSKGMMKPIHNGITVWRNTAKEDAIEAEKSGAEEIHDGMFRVWKQRSTGKHFKRKMWFDPDSRRFRLQQVNPDIVSVDTAQTDLSF